MISMDAADQILRLQLDADTVLPIRNANFAFSSPLYMGHKNFMDP